MQSITLLEFALLFSMAISLVAAIPVFMCARRLRRRYLNAQWLPVPAIVESSSVQVEAGESPIFTPVIRYRYEYEGMWFVSSILSPDFHQGGSTIPSFAEKWVSLLPAGTHITAFVNQREPATAVLFPEFRNSSWWFSAGVVLAGFGLLCAIVSVLHFSSYLRYMHA